MMQKMGPKKGYWIFLGMMGAGKTTLGQTVAVITKKLFLDTDFLIEKKNSSTVLEIFQEKGEPFFRAEERALLKNLQVEEGILSTGGGLVTEKENWKEIRRLGVSIFLDIDPLILKKRLEESGSQRPFMQDKNWKKQFDKLYQMRRPYYLQSDVIIQLTDAPIEKNAYSIVEFMNQQRYESV